MAKGKPKSKKSVAKIEQVHSITFRYRTLVRTVDIEPVDSIDGPGPYLIRVEIFQYNDEPGYYAQAYQTEFIELQPSAPAGAEDDEFEPMEEEAFDEMLYIPNPILSEGVHGETPEDVLKQIVERLNQVIKFMN